jgi:tetratricopeptide (TPR) repeat protein
MRFNYGLAPALIGVSIVVVQTQVAVALSSQEVGKIAKEITVLIKNSNNNPGSGVIIKRDGNSYTVLTAAHVVGKQDKYEITTYDNQRYAVNYSTVKKLSDVDLAVVQFTSNKAYNTAKIGNSDGSTEGTVAYVTGFPKATAAISSSIYSFVEGKITANASKALKDGYALVYNNDTLPGMSGGAVLNEKGELIGIHGRADTSTENLKFSDINPNIAVKTGFNLGIPINTFLQLSSNVGVNLGVSAPPLVATAPKTDDFFIRGVDKFNKGEFKEAIADLNEAIRINPNNAQAYIGRGVARTLLKDLQGAIADYNQAIKIDPNNADIYNLRGNARTLLKDTEGAIADYNQAIKINPNNVAAYFNRGTRYQFIGDSQRAIADFNQAIKIAPKNYSNIINVYYYRGLARYKLKDWQGAIADFNQVIKINPNYSQSYVGRGMARYELKDTEGAIADFNQAIKINPNDVEAYSKRGVVRYGLGDKQGAIADFNQAIKIKPNDARGYFGLGFVRAKLGDKQGAIADLQKAANLYLEAGNTELYQQSLELIRQLQQ